MWLMSTIKILKLWGILSRRVAVLRSEGRIPGVQRVGVSLGVPVDAEKLADARVKSGRYIKSNKENEENG